MGYRIGVDLGTTFTAAAVDDGTGAMMLGLGNRALTVPSVVFIASDGMFLFGEAADRRAATDPSRAAREFKRRIGDTVPILLAGQPFSPQTLSAKLLAWTISVAQERQGAAPDEVVVTYPANWGGYKRELLQQVVALADVPTAITCTEPEAAATQYASRARLSPGDKVAVYDLGGGTFDVCVLEKHAPGFKVLGAPDGVEHLGGIDFDEAVFQHVMGMLSQQLAEVDLTSPQVTDGLARLRRECVDAKEALSSDVETTLPVVLPGITTSVRLTRSELEGLITSPLRDTLDAMQRALRSAGVTAAELTMVVLVGGSSRIPLVSHLLQSGFGVRTALDTHPKHDIALGAVQYHASESSGQAPAAAPTVIQWPTRNKNPAEGQVFASRPAEGPQASAESDPSEHEARPVPPKDREQQVRSGPPAWTPTAGAESEAEPQPEPSRRRRRTLLIVGAGAGSACLAAASAWLALGHDNAHGRPEGPVLPGTDLVLTQRVGETFALQVVDTEHPSHPDTIVPRQWDLVGAALSPDRRTIVYVATQDGTTSLRIVGSDGTGDRPLSIRSCPEPRARPAWDPTGSDRLVLVCNSYQRIIDVGIDGSDPIPLATGVRIQGPTVNDRGQVAYIESASRKEREGSLMLTDVNGAAPTQVTPTTGTFVDIAPAFSPDGTRLAFSRSPSPDLRETQSNIWVIGVDGNGPHQITHGSDLDLLPSWSPDGNRLVFTRMPSGGITPATPGTIEVTPTDADRPQTLTSAVGGIYAAALWSRR